MVICPLRNQWENNEEIAIKKGILGLPYYSFITILFFSRYPPPS